MKNKIKHKSGDFPRYKVREIVADERRKKFYYSQCIYEGSEVEIIFREKGNIVIKCGKTKIGLSSDAAKEIVFYK